MVQFEDHQALSEKSHNELDDTCEHTKLANEYMDTHRGVDDVFFHAVAGKTPAPVHALHRGCEAD